MTDLWLPGADRVVSRGGTMEGPRHVRSVVWHTSESDPDLDPKSIARYVIGRGSEYHVVWNAVDGRFAQIMPATDSARALRNDGDWRTNRVGAIRIQVCVLGRAADAPLAGGLPLVGWDRLRAWLRSWQIPEVDARDRSRSRGGWCWSGHTDHRSAPGNDHTDPGQMDIDALFHQEQALEGEPEMLIVRQGSRKPILIHGAATTVIDEASADSMVKAGIPNCAVTATVYDRFKAQ